MKLITKNKAITYILIFSFIFFVIGLFAGIYIQQKHCAFWSSLVEQDNIEQIEKLTKQNEAMVDRLIQLQNAINNYLMPKSSPDILRPSREE